MEDVSWAGPNPPFPLSHQMPQLQFSPMDRDHEETIKSTKGAAWTGPVLALQKEQGTL